MAKVSANMSIMFCFHHIWEKLASKYEYSCGLLAPSVKAKFDCWKFFSRKNHSRAPENSAQSNGCVSGQKERANDLR